jgi:hypothetical protein
MNRQNGKSIFASSILICVVLLGSGAHAALISFDFSGVLTNNQDPSGLLSGAFQSGDSFVGNVTYDTTLASGSLPGLYYFLSGGTISITSGGHTFFGSTAASTQSCWPSASSSCIPPLDIAVVNNGPAEGDRLAYDAYYLTYDGQPAPGAPTNSLLQLRLQDTVSQTALSSNALPTSPPDLALFNIHQIQLFANGPNLMAPPLYSFFGNVTSISTPTAVPEPGTLSLLGSGVIGLILLRRRRAC